MLKSLPWMAPLLVTFALCIASESSARHVRIESDSRRDPPRVDLRPPALQGWGGVAVAIPTAAETRYSALAYYFRTSIFAGPARKPWVVGYARRGTTLAVKKRGWGRGCRRGRWYRLADVGYVCNRRGFRVSSAAQKLTSLHYSLPDARTPLPFNYAKAKDGALRFDKLPSRKTLAALAKLEKGDKLPDAVDQRMDGIFLLALHRRVEHEGTAFFQTVDGKYVRIADIQKRFRLSGFHGELLGGAKRLPLAFVYGEDRALLRREGRRLVRIGVARKHARFRPRRVVKIAGKRFVQTRGGLLIAREHVRLLRRIKRPSRVSAKQKWIHVDLSQQSLVAYQGDRPLLATLISSGKKGFEPPVGTFRVVYKHVSTKMDGPDPDNGWYEVNEVPWTMYYWKSYAIHGAYWHEGFGKPRSHGCTNVAPADARWLFYWSTPRMPAGWHGRRGQGTYVRVTN